MKKKSLIMLISSLMFVCLGIIAFISVYANDSDDLSANKEVNQINLIVNDSLTIKVKQEVSIVYAVEPYDSSVELFSSSSNIEIIENKITGIKAGMAVVNLVARYEGLVAEKSVNVTILPIMENVSVKLMHDNEEVSTIYRGTKADGSREKYSLLFTADINFNNPKIETEDIDIIDTKIENNLLSVIFTQITDKIDIKIVDHDKEFSFNIKVLVKDFLTKLDVSLSRQTIYLFNENYLNEANADNFYSTSNIFSNEDYTLEYDKDVIEIKDSVITPLKPGVTSIVFKATDGSDVSESLGIKVIEIKSQTITILDEENLMLNKSVAYDIKGVSIEPIYHYDKIEVTYVPSSGITITNNKLIATECGNVDILINGELVKTINVDIIKEYDFVISGAGYNSTSNIITLNSDFAVFTIKFIDKETNLTVPTTYLVTHSENLYAEVKMGRLTIEKLTSGNGEIVITSKEYNVSIKIIVNLN